MAINPYYYSSPLPDEYNYETPEERINRLIREDEMRKEAEAKALAAKAKAVQEQSDVNKFYGIPQTPVAPQTPRDMVNSLVPQQPVQNPAQNAVNTLASNPLLENNPEAAAQAKKDFEVLAADFKPDNALMNKPYEDYKPPKEAPPQPEDTWFKPSATLGPDGRPIFTGAQNRESFFKALAQAGASLMGDSRDIPLGAKFGSAFSSGLKEYDEQQKAQIAAQKVAYESAKEKAYAENARTDSWQKQQSTPSEIAARNAQTTANLFPTSGQHFKQQVYLTNMQTRSAEKGLKLEESAIESARKSAAVTIGMNGKKGLGQDMYGNPVLTSEMSTYDKIVTRKEYYEAFYNALLTHSAAGRESIMQARQQAEHYRKEWEAAQKDERFARERTESEENKNWLGQKKEYFYPPEPTVSTPPNQSPGYNRGFTQDNGNYQKSYSQSGPAGLQQQRPVSRDQVIQQDTKLKGYMSDPRFQRLAPAERQRKIDEYIYNNYGF